MRVTGEGPPIVLVHGLGVSGRYLLPTARVLARSRTVLVPDLPGYGESEGPKRPLGVAQLAHALAGCLHELALSRPPLLGNSLGCQVLVDLAARRPHSTGPLVLVGPTVERGRRSFPQQALALLRDWAREPSLTPVAAYDYARFGPLRFLRTARFALDDRPEDKLPAVESPVLVVRGERDPLTSDAWVEELARRARRGRVVVVPRAAHALNYTHPEELARITLEFLHEVE